MQAAEAAECARRVGLFWEMHDLLFRKPAALERADLSANANRLNIDSRAFDACLSTDSEAAVRRDIATAEFLKSASTPSFFVGILDGVDRMKAMARIGGAQPITAFRSALNAAISATRQAVR